MKKRNREYQATYRSKHKQFIKIAKRKYNKANKEKISAYNRMYYQRRKAQTLNQDVS
jgi:hypothetical protein